MESYLLFIALFFIFFIIIPFRFSVHLSFNLKAQQGILSLHLANFKLTIIVFELKNQNIIIKTKNKTEELELQLTKEQMKFIKQLYKELLDKVKIKNLICYSKVGTNDAMETALINGFIDIIVSCVFAYVKNYKPTSSINLISYPTYNSNSFIVVFHMIFSISIFDILYSLIMSLIISKRSEKYETI